MEPVTIGIITFTRCTVHAPDSTGARCLHCGALLVRALEVHAEPKDRAA